MTATATATFPDRSTPRGAPRRQRGGSLLLDTWWLAGRALRESRRAPQAIFFGVVQPIVILLMFVYVFGGAIGDPGGVAYVQFVTPAMVVWTASFAGLNTSIGLAADLRTGLVDRFRSQPIARAAILAGRTCADAVRVFVQVVPLLLVATAVGFRFEGGPARAVGAVCLAVVFGFALTWVFAWIGLMVRDEEAANAASFAWLFPLTFMSSAYVPVETMPGWLQAFAANNPITAVTDATRALSLGQPATEAVVATLAWAVGITAVFGALATARYRRL